MKKKTPTIYEDSSIAINGKTISKIAELNGIMRNMKKEIKSLRKINKMLKNTGHTKLSTRQGCLGIWSRVRLRCKQFQNWGR